MATEKKKKSRIRGSLDVHTPRKNVLPRVLNVLEFTQARAHEVHALKQALDESSNKIHARAYQQLPRHLRRRTMSHNIHRLPVRLRMIAKREMEKDPPKPPNRHRRRRAKHVMASFASRSQHNQWLETHVWHAKRMHMSSLWKHRLAMSPADKSIRFSYRASTHLCSIYDASYISCMQLSGKVRDICRLFTTITDSTNNSTLLDNSLYINGGIAGQLLLYEPDCFPLRACAPVQFIWNSNPNLTNESDPNRYLWLWVHAAVFEQLFDILESLCSAVNSSTAYEDDTSTIAGRNTVSLLSLRDQFVRFELSGSRCHAVLATVIQTSKESSASSNITPSSGTETWDQLRNLTTSASLPSSIVLAVDAKDLHDIPASQFHQPFSGGSSSVSPATIEKCTTSQNLLSSFEFMSISLQDWCNGHLAYSPLWDANVRKCIIERSLSRKKKKNDRDDEATSAATTSSIPILLIQRSGNLPRGVGSGWDIIIPAEWGMIFWTSLISSGARAIALENRRRFQTEQNIFSFPEDYPDTLAGQMWNNWIGLDKFRQHMKRPPAKRLNFSKLGIISFFQPNWLFLNGDSINHTITEETKKNEDVAENILYTTTQYFQNHSSSSSCSFYVKRNQKENFSFLLEKSNNSDYFGLVGIILNIPSRGHPADNAGIYLATSEDYSKWCKYGKTWQGVEEIIQKKKLNNIITCRKLIGYVTSGMFSLFRGQGHALGFCHMSLLNNAISTSKNSRDRLFVLFRNPNSRTYRPSYLKLIDNITMLS